MVLYYIVVNLLSKTVPSFEIQKEYEQAMIELPRNDTLIEEN